jgi:TM2 domain-containing membrane protein YozV
MCWNREERSVTCAFHPDQPVAAYCQFCGKPLCSACAHSIQNIVGCEPCMTARLNAPPVGWSSVHIGKQRHGKSFQFSAYTPHPPVPPYAPPYVPPVPGSVPPYTANPGLAFGLGWIPGVGAMYNGQFAKGLLHVLIFVMLIDLTRWNGAIGICVAAWVFYQVFDAYQTALARRDGLPLPNPLGLNDIGSWVTGHRSRPGTPAQPAQPGAAADPAAQTPPSAPASPEFAPPFAPGSQPPIAGFAPFVHSMPPVPPDQYDLPEIHHGLPTGAVVLVALGVLFLLNNFGVLHGRWIDHSWPLFLIGLGIWILWKRSNEPPAPGNPPTE